MPLYGHHCCTILHCSVRLELNINTTPCLLGGAGGPLCLQTQEIHETLPSDGLKICLKDIQKPKYLQYRCFQLPEETLETQMKSLIVSYCTSTCKNLLKELQKNKTIFLLLCRNKILLKNLFMSGHRAQGRNGLRSCFGMIKSLTEVFNKFIVHIILKRHTNWSYIKHFSVC